MCNSVHLGTREFNSPRALAVLLGGTEKIIWQESNPFHNAPKGEDWQDLDLCLCAVDLAATLKQAGFEWKREVDPMMWTILEKSLLSTNNKI